MLGCDAVKVANSRGLSTLAGLAAETGRIVNTFQIDIAIRSDQMRFCYGFHLIAEKQESTAQAGLRFLQALPEALVHHNFDIYVTVKFAVIGYVLSLESPLCIASAFSFYRQARHHSRHIHLCVAKEQQVTCLAFNLGVVGDVHDKELTGLFVFDPNRVRISLAKKFIAGVLIVEMEIHKLNDALARVDLSLTLLCYIARAARMEHTPWYSRFVAAPVTLSRSWPETGLEEIIGDLLEADFRGAEKATELGKATVKVGRVPAGYLMSG
jgi:hypothetical protein